MANLYIPYDGPVVTREAARLEGSPRFFNGALCKNGHCSQRLVSDAKCVSCGDMRSVKHRARKKERYQIDNAEFLAERQAHRAPEAKRSRRNVTLAAWRERNREGLRVYSAAWREGHKDNVKGYTDARKDKKHEYDRDRYAKNPQKSKDQSREYHLRNKPQALERARSWQLANPDRRRAIANSWKSANRDAVCADAKRRYAQESKATPPWADQGAILDIYTECARITRETGALHHVDHIYPLRGKTVCGLHVADNLRIISAVENCRKGNRLPIEAVHPRVAISSARQRVAA